MHSNIRFGGKLPIHLVQDFTSFRTPLAFLLMEEPGGLELEMN